MDLVTGATAEEMVHLRPMGRKSGIAFLLIGSLTCLPAKAVASLFESVSDGQLVCEATDVVHGQVAAAHSAWDEERGAIWTTATVRIDEAIRGNQARGATVTVKEIGGTVDGYTIQAEGFPSFQQGEEVVLLLKPWEDEPSVYRVWGYGRGKFVVSRRDGRAAVASRHDVVEAGRPTMFTDRIPPTALLEHLTRELGSLARECQSRGRP